MQRNILFVGILSAAAIVSDLAACASTTTDIDPADSGQTSETSGKADAEMDTGPSGTGSPDTGSSGTSGDKDSSTPSDDTTCAAVATLGECANCCAANHKTGYATFANAVIGCACKAGTGPCLTKCAASACATPASNPTPGSPCEICLQSSIAQNGVCQAPVLATCSADADCLLQQKCVMQCQGKPVN